MSDGSRTGSRKRSGAVTLGLVSTLALALTSCDGQPDLRCVDTATYKTVADRLCRNAPGKGYADTDRYQWYQRDDGSSGYGGAGSLPGYHPAHGGTLSRGSGSGDGLDGSGTGTGHGVTRGGLGGHGSGSHGG